MDYRLRGNAKFWQLARIPFTVSKRNPGILLLRFYLKPFNHAVAAMPGADRRGVCQRI
jgi:hypothetical protein